MFSAVGGERWAVVSVVCLGSAADREAVVDLQHLGYFAGPSPRLALRVSAADAMCAPDSRASTLFEQALAIPYVDRWPFDRARVHLAHGTRLRRLHRPADAQPHLITAYETFRRMGARGWARRTAEEMRAAGLPTPAGPHPPRTVLTGRDLEIAGLVAAGLSNQQIGSKLFLSPRTVGSRLYRIFPRLGVSSRAALRDALADQPGPD
jgi:DNA-binding CsgD family transcriptional regulator